MGRTKKTVTKPSTFAALLLPHVLAMGGTVRSRAARLGIAKSVLGRYETGQRTPVLADLEAMAATLGLRVTLVPA